MDSNKDPRFGRVAYFIIVNPETMEYETVENSQNLNLPQGAGIQAGKTIIDNNAMYLLRVIEVQKLLRCCKVPV